MTPAPDLTPEFCLRIVVAATPSPNHFHQGDDPTEKTLFDLGVVDDLQIRLYVKGVQEGLAPQWQIDPANLKSSRDTTLQDAADSVQTGAVPAGAEG